MILNRLEAWVDGIALTSLHPMVFLEDISCTAAETEIASLSVAGRDGARLLSSRRSTPTVTITVRLLIEDRATRHTVYQQLVQWASGHELMISDRPGLALRCVCTSMPAMQSVAKWTEPFQVIMSGFEHACWEESIASSLSLSGSSGSGQLYIPGNGGDVCGEVSVIPPTGSTLNTLTLTVGNTSMSFSSLGATSANPFSISYDDRRIQQIRVGTTSAMSKRSGTSADDLLGTCGKHNAISFTANVHVSATFRFKGAWA
jgi:hypothetical protein